MTLYSCPTVPTVMVVDDEPSICLVVGEMLRECNLHVLTAHDGFDALRKAAQSRDRVALAILDFSMPGMDCETLINELTKLNDQIKLIIASGQPGPLFDDPESLGINAMISKPYSMRRLTDIVLSLINDGQDSTEKSA